MVVDHSVEENTQRVSGAGEVNQIHQGVAAAVAVRRNTLQFVLGFQKSHETLDEQNVVVLVAEPEHVTAVIHRVAGLQQRYFTVMNLFLLST